MSSLPAAARSDQKSAQELIEEAVHLLRRAPLGWLAIYYLGSGTWVLGLLFFWAHTTWFAPSVSSLAWGSLGLSLLFVGCKTAQALFCGHLLDQQLQRKSPALSLSLILKIAGSQLRLQTWGLFALPLAAIASVPFGWTYAFYQNLTVLGANPANSNLVSSSWNQAKLWPQQNHLGLLLLSVVGLAVLGNLAGAFFVLPWIGRHLLGLDNFLGLEGLALFNSTFFVSLVSLVWLAVDPLVKTFYVLRVYYGQAQRTGEDLSSELSALLNLRARVLVGGLLLMLFIPGGSPLSAADPAPVESTHRLDPDALNHSIDQVLTQRDFQWRLRPLPGREDESDDSAIARFFRKGGLIVREVLRSVGRGVRDLIKWVDRLFGGRNREHESEKPTYRFLSWFLYLFIGIAVLLIGVVVTLMWRKARRTAPEALTLANAPPVAPDLRDSSVTASQLPSEGWLGLAHQQIAAGEWRLALRALYLASLANLGAEGLITLARFKTDLDYENELGRRALSRRELLTQFSTRRHLFQRSWYGQVPAAETDVRAWLNEMKP